MEVEHTHFGQTTNLEGKMDCLLFMYKIRTKQTLHCLATYLSFPSITHLGLNSKHSRIKWKLKTRIWAILGIKHSFLIIFAKKCNFSVLHFFAKILAENLKESADRPLCSSVLLAGLCYFWNRDCMCLWLTPDSVIHVILPGTVAQSGCTSVGALLAGTRRKSWIICTSQRKYILFTASVLLIFAGLKLCTTCLHVLRFSC